MIPEKIIHIDQYVAMFPPSTQTILEQLRVTIRNAVPEAEEVISYQMPAYKYFGVLVYFAAYKNHIGFYPTASGIEAFKVELAGYKGAKGSVQFPIDQPIPFDLIAQIVEFRVQENQEKAALKRKR